MDIKIITFNQLLDLKVTQKTFAPEPQPDDLYFLCWTSGTTGDSKGAMLSHKNIIATIGQFEVAGEVTLRVRQESYLSYLPFAHGFEQLLFHLGFLFGCTINFYCGDITKITEDIQKTKPTIFVSVPRLYNRIYNKILQGINEANCLKRCLVERGISSKTKKFALTGDTQNCFWDKIVFKKFKTLMGGRIRLLVNGAAPLTEEIQRFLPVVLCAPMINGYGQTENMAACCAVDFYDPTTGHVGGPLSNVELKIVSVPEMNYFVTDVNENGEPMPRGELLTHGPLIFLGYYKRPDLTNECKTEDGWVYTGDIVALLPKTRAIKIIDRRKNIFKLSQGEYIAPEKIENIYNLSNLIAQNFVYGDSHQAYLVAIIVPDEEYVVKKWSKQQKNIKLHNLTFKEFCQTEELKKDIQQDILKIGKENQLSGLEFVKDIQLCSEPFTVENGILTPTMKLKRFQAKVTFSKEIQEMYQRQGQPKA